MTTDPLDPFSEVVDERRRWKPEWYSWIRGLVRDEDEQVGTGRVSIRSFGGGVGQGNQDRDDAAFISAISHLNSLGSEARTCIFFPPGTYNLGPCPVTLLASQCAIEAEPGAFINFHSTNAGDTWLKIGAAGSPVVSHVEILGIDIDFAPAFVAPQAGTTFIELQATFDIHVEGCYFRNFVTLLKIGKVGDPTSGVFSTVFRLSSGFGYNMAGAAIEINNGAGLFATDLQFFVGGVTPGFGPGAVQNTEPGRYLVFCPAGGNWDTFQLDNSLFQFFYSAIVLVSDPSGICIDFFINNTIFGNCQEFGIFMVCAPAGVQSNFHLVNSWIDNYLGNHILLTGAGGYFGNHSFINNFFLQCGSSSFRMTGRPTQGIIYAYNRIIGANRDGTAIGAIQIDAGTIGFQIIGNYGNFDDAGAGTPWRAPYGIFVAESCDEYLITGNSMKGSTGSIGVTPDTGASRGRRCTNNQFADAEIFGGYSKTTNLGAQVFWSNTTPFVHEVYVSGGTVANMIVQGQNVGVNHGTFRVEPGETLSTNATVAPLFVIRALG